MWLRSPLAGGALKLTIGEYLTPHHDQILPGVGLQPDLTCSATPGWEDTCIAKAAKLARTAHPAARLPASRQSRAMQPIMGLSAASAGWGAAIRRMPVV